MFITYNILIIVYFTNIQFEEAYKLYKEANEKGFILSINAYNSAIKTAIYVKEGADHKWLHIQVDILFFLCLYITRLSLGHSEVRSTEIKIRYRTK